jgi:hypothetical protein
MKDTYKASFLVGTRVRIASRTRLERHRSEWKFHHKLQSDQLDYGNSITTVKEVSFYHGGDPLYVLKNVPGIWHEELLELEARS